MDTQIANIADDISNCILFLGPELQVSPEGKHYRDYFSELVCNNNGVSYFRRDNLFWLQPTGGGSSATPVTEFVTLAGKVKQFYDAAGNRVLLNQISQIPFSLIINVCPDRNLNKIFDQKKMPYTPVLATDPRDINMLPPSPEKPVIYHVLGRVDKMQSMVLTHKDLFKSIRSLMQNDYIPAPILSALRNASSYLFLGFRFETWYYQLLLSILDEDTKSLRVGAPQETDDDIVSIMSSHFRVSFYQSEPAVFVNQLYQKLVDTNVTLRSPKNRGAVFFSYAWEESLLQTGEWFVDLLQKDMKVSEGIQFMRDKNVMTYMDSITDFMNQIGLAKTVVMVISNKYLNSPYCLTEALMIYNNQNFNDGAIK